MSEKKPLECYLEERVSSRTGKPFKCVIVKLAPNVEKMVFLTDSERALVELTY